MSSGGSTTPSEEYYAVILAGGYGERFWPLSTSKRPKQLLELLGDETMLAMAVGRLEGLVPPERVIVLTSEDLVEATRSAAPALPAGNVIGEPMRRDTAAAVALGAAVVKARSASATFCVLTADHVIGDLDDFRSTLRAGLELASAEDVLVTIGIGPTHPSTAYGYIEAGESHSGSQDAVKFDDVLRFVEKPDRTTATSYLAAGTFWWNSGMFIWSVASIQAAYRAHCPALSNLIDELVPAVDTDRFGPVLAAAFEPLEKISIDYALMEHADNIVMAQGRFAWDDVGSWPEVGNHFPADQDGNVVVGDAMLLEASGNIVLSDGRLTALIGVDDLVIVQTDDVTLICPKDRAQEVKAVVALLREKGGWDHLL